MNVLQVHTRYRQPGGEDSVVAGEREMLESGGHRVEVAEFHNPEGVGGAAIALTRAPWNSTSARDVVEQARRMPADVVHVHNTWFALSPAVFPALKADGFPVVTTIHNYRPMCVNALLYRNGELCELCVGKMPWRGVVYRCYRHSATQSAVVAVTIGTHRLRKTWDRDVDVVIALSSFASDKLVESGIDPGRIVVKPNVVADPGTRTRPPSRGSTVLYIGRMTEDKGVLDLLAAWEAARTVGFELVMVGDGPLLAEARSRTVPHVSVLGRRNHDEVRRLMLEASALILPSRWYEGLPMVLIEAMAAGLPSIVPDHGALPETIGESGVRYASGDRHSLAAAIERLLSTEDLDQLGEMARDLYSRRFTPETGVTRLEEIYLRALESTKGLGA